ncbi:MAG: hypothetical protein CM15mP88_1850 [Pseudomonadota bacterium]|nr:MAG: hypothetical protein CM15mP88_1850 [Pseudomonadota bacterium]
MPEQQLRYQNEDALILNGAVIKSQGSEVLIKFQKLDPIILFLVPVMFF